jgi:hypothetical protein
MLQDIHEKLVAAQVVKKNFFFLCMTLVCSLGPALNRMMIK